MKYKKDDQFILCVASNLFCWDDGIEEIFLGTLDQIRSHPHIEIWRIKPYQLFLLHQDSYLEVTKDIDI